MLEASAWNPEMKRIAKPLPVGGPFQTSQGDLEHGCGGCPLHSPKDYLPTISFSQNPQLIFWFNNSTFQLLLIQFQFSVVTIPYLLVEKQPPSCWMLHVAGPLRRPGARRCCAEIGPQGEKMCPVGGVWPWIHENHGDRGGIKKWIEHEKEGSKMVKTIQVWSKTISVGLPKVHMHKDKFGLLFTGQGWNTSWKLGTLWDMGISPRRSQKNGWTLDLSYELYPAFSSKGRIESILGPFTHLRHDLEVKQTLPSGSKFTNHSHYCF